MRGSINAKTFTYKGGGIKEIDEILLEWWTERGSSPIALVMNETTRYSAWITIVTGMKAEYNEFPPDNGELVGYVNRFASSTSFKRVIIPVRIDNTMPDGYIDFVLEKEVKVQVTVELKFCYGHRLMNYAGKCNRLHGHNGRLLVTFTRVSLDDQGFVVDFSKAKEVLKEFVDQELDHLMLLEVGDPVAEALKELEEDYRLLPHPPTAENIAKNMLWACKTMEAAGRFGKGVLVDKVVLYETDSCYAEVSG